MIFIKHIRVVMLQEVGNKPYMGIHLLIVLFAFLILYEIFTVEGFFVAIVADKPIWDDQYVPFTIECLKIRSKAEMDVPPYLFWVILVPLTFVYGTLCVARAIPRFFAYITLRRRENKQFLFVLPLYAPMIEQLLYAAPKQRFKSTIIILVNAIE